MGAASLQTFFLNNDVYDSHRLVKKHRHNKKKTKQNPAETVTSLWSKDMQYNVKKEPALFVCDRWESRIKG